MSYFEEQICTDESTKELQQLLESIYGWMETNDFHNEHTRQRFEKITSQLDDNQRNILFLAEFSRGKSELINATIFGSTGKRYLPSTPGRTTRCTTVIQYDPSDLPSIRLLPTLSSPEIQRQPISILKNYPSHWEQIMFAASDSDNVIKSLEKICETEMVTPEIAHQLGFIQELNQDMLTKLDLIDGKLAIPKWRHAIINFPHPLLKRGLSIVDTPGLNALGIEPELTLRALESANAIVFVLSADTGITRTELEAWQQHVTEGSADNILVVLNKIDTLWDELKTQTEIEKEIKKQVKEVARILNIPANRIFPVSAQKALLARKRNDHRLIAASGIKRYEEALAETISLTNRRGIIARANKDLAPTMSALHRVLQQRVEATSHHIGEIKLYKSSQGNVAEGNIQKVKKETQRLKRATEKLDLFRVDLKVDFERFQNKLDIFLLDKMIAQYRLEISNQLTTPGLQREMNDFQVEAVDRFRSALTHIYKLEKKLVKVYKTFEQILSIDGLTPRKIHPEIYLKSLRGFKDKHEKYAKGLSMVMTEQNALRDRYHASVMVRLRRLYSQTRDDIELWCRTALVPLELEIKERESQLRKRLLSLERIRRKDSDIDDELRVIESRLEKHQQRLTTLNHFNRRIEEIAASTVLEPNNVIDLHTRTLAG